MVIAIGYMYIYSRCVSSINSTILCYKNLLFLLLKASNTFCHPQTRIITLYYCSEPTFYHIFCSQIFTREDLQYVYFNPFVNFILFTPGDTLLFNRIILTCPLLLRLLPKNFLSFRIIISVPIKL